MSTIKNRGFLFSITLTVLAMSFMWFVVFWFSADISTEKIAGLYTEGNQIIREDTKEPIRLVGVVSDYFRYGYYSTIQGHGLENEFKNLKTVKEKGGNVVGLYLSDYLKIQKSIGELDTYIAYANDNGMYVYLAPVGHNFYESNPYNENYIRIGDEDDLTQLIQFLSSRYKDNPGVIYQLAAEADAPYEAWIDKQKNLLGIIRSYTDGPVIVSTPSYRKYVSLPIFYGENLIYQTGGYVSDDDKKGDPSPSLFPHIADQHGLSNKYPVLVGEFGGNTQRDFSSQRDLKLIEKILEEIKKKNLSFTSYRIGPNFRGDPLAIFDEEGGLTRRGELYFKYFKLD